MTDDELQSFVSNSISSVWTLETLLFLKRTAPTGHRIEDLVRELRSSTTAVADALRHLQQGGLVIEDLGAHYFRPASPALEDVVTEVQRLYALKPGAIIKLIVLANNTTLAIFANSFKFRE